MSVFRCSCAPSSLVLCTARCTSIRAVAHEIGHACGLRDVYVSSHDETSLTVTGEITRDRLDTAWGGTGERSFYPGGLQQAQLLRLAEKEREDGVKDGAYAALARQLSESPGLEKREKRFCGRDGARPSPFSCGRGGLKILLARTVFD